MPSHDFEPMQIDDRIVHVCRGCGTTARAPYIGECAIGISGFLRNASCPRCTHGINEHSLLNPPCRLCDCPLDRWEVVAAVIAPLIPVLPASEPTVYDDIRAERERAHAKHGDNSMENQSLWAMIRLTILLEEVGEVAREFNEHALGKPMNWDGLRAELIQVAAMAAAWADAIANPPAEWAWMVKER